jgi:arylsulfatase
MDHTFVRGENALAAGTRQVRMEFDYDGGGLAKGGAIRLYTDGDLAASGRIERTEPFVYSADETCDVGSDDASSVSPEYSPASSYFTGTVNWVELAMDDAADDEDHYLTAQERFRVAMAIQ